MTPAELATLCVRASETYLEYLRQNKKNRGSDEIEIWRKAQIDADDHVWELGLKRRVYDLDAIKIRHKITGREYGQNEFAVKEYDADTGVLIVKFAVAPDGFAQAQAQDLLVISSLLFLVENVKKWFQANGEGVRLPTSDPQLPEDAPLARLDVPLPGQKDVPLPGQKEAIRVAVSCPFSYVWGPPGTGKTRLVLTQAVLRFIQNGRAPVGVFAPTNIALERAMDALLEGGLRLGMEKKRFLRLGVPSRHFAQAHPEACEIQGLEKRIKDAQREIENLGRAIYWRRGEDTLHYSGPLMVSILEKMADLFKERDAILQREVEIRKALDENEARLRRIWTRLRRLFSDSPLPEEKERDAMHAQLRQADEEIRKFDQKIEIGADEFRRVRTESRKLRTLQEDFKPHRWKEARARIEAILRETKVWLAVQKALIAPYKDRGIEELHDSKVKGEKKLAHLKAARIEERIEKCAVVGMTLDCFIGRFRKSAPRFHHVFLDEAGYAPLVKALALFRFGAPITMLGDHKQLPPVVEMVGRGRKKGEELDMPKYVEVRLWASSAILAEVAFQEELSAEEFLDRIWRADRRGELELKDTQQPTLNVTLRFGRNLSDILDELFYHCGLSSATREELRIYKLDAPQTRTPKKGRERENPDECEAIARLLSDGVDTDFAIITPYRDQVDELSARFPQLWRDDRILTIHKAQGREWDTVILSVADGRRTPRGPWFANTLNEKSRGAQVMNTAVSRAKRRLIVVSDAHYWQNREDRQKQLLSRLLDIAEPWTGDDG